MSRLRRLAGLLGAVTLIGAATSAASASTSIGYASQAYLSVSRSGAAVYVNALVKQDSPSGTVIRSPQRTVYLQRELNGSWQNVLSRTTDWYGTFSVGYLSPPTYSYRLVVAPSGSAAGTTSATATPPPLGIAMAAGKTLIGNVIDQNTLRSPSGVFMLRVDGGQFGINETEDFPDFGYGAETWRVVAPGNAYPITDRSRLTLQTDGNLVFRSSGGALIWASRTSGQNVLYLQNDGNLVLYNPAGHAVWQTGTGRLFLLAGRTLASGQHMIDKLLHGYHPDTTLVMQPGGDLVLSYGNSVTWHSNTHVPGSRAYLSNGGNLVVYSPSNQVLWHSNSPGVESALFLNVCGGADIDHRDPGPIQHLPPGPQIICN